MDRKYHQSDGSYDKNKDIRFKTPQLRSDLRNCFNLIYENTEDLDVVIPMLIYYQDRDRIFYSIRGSESFDYKKKIS